MFPFETRFFGGVMKPIKMCRFHRDSASARNKTPLGLARAKRARESKVGRASNAKRYEVVKESQHYKNMKKKWKKTPKGKECNKRSRHTEAGKARQLRNSKKVYSKRRLNTAWKLKQGIGNRIREMLRNTGTISGKVSEYTSIESGESLKQHIESLFPKDGSMSWENWGHRGEDIWNIGHRIAQAMYDAQDPNDMKRCWSFANIFPQWSIENQILGTTLPSNEELLELKTIWPKSWRGKLPNSDERICLEARSRNVFGNFSNKDQLLSEDDSSEKDSSSDDDFEFDL